MIRHLILIMKALTGTEAKLLCWEQLAVIAKFKFFTLWSARSVRLFFNPKITLMVMKIKFAIKVGEQPFF